MAQVILPLKTLKLHEGNIAQNWRKFKKAWPMKSQPGGKVKASVLLSVIREEGTE